MASPEPTIELDQRFSSEGAQPLPWTAVVEVIDGAKIFWLSTALVFSGVPIKMPAFGKGGEPCSQTRYRF